MLVIENMVQNIDVEVAGERSGICGSSGVQPFIRGAAQRQHHRF
jgi:hypothetical protein